MRTTGRPAAASVIALLLEQPHRFSLFQAVRLLIQWLEEQEIPGERALHECLRFENSLSFAFPAAQIAALEMENDTETDAGQRAPDGAPQARFRRIRITPAFLGLLGGTGALPYHYTERLQALRHSDEPGGAKAFFDLFTNRIVGLAYECWRKHQVQLPPGEAGQPFSARLLALSGHALMDGPDAHGGRMRDTIAFHAGLLQQRPVSAAVMAAALSSYLKAPVLVEENIGHWDSMAETEQISLGQANATLGEDTILGSASWRPDLRVRLRIGPLGAHQYRQFMPDGQARTRLREMLSLLGNPSVVYEVRPVIRADAIRPMRLNSVNPMPQLGADTFLVSEAQQGDRDDMVFEIRLLDPLPALPIM